MSPATPSCLPLRTARLTIDQLTALDAPTLAAYRSDPAVARFQSWRTPYPVADAETLIGAVALLPLGTPGHASQLAVRYHRGDEVVHIGDVYTQVLAETPHAAEIGITLATEHHGRGLASEAVSAVVGVLVGPIVHKAIAFVDARNDASLALFDRLGFRREGHLADSSRCPDGTFADEILFGLTVPQLAAQAGQPDGRPAVHPSAQLDDRRGRQGGHP